MSKRVKKFEFKRNRYIFHKIPRYFVDFFEHVTRVVIYNSNDCQREENLFRRKEQQCPSNSYLWNLLKYLQEIIFPPNIQIYSLKKKNSSSRTLIYGKILERIIIEMFRIYTKNKLSPTSKTNKFSSIFSKLWSKRVKINFSHISLRCALIFFYFSNPDKSPPSHILQMNALQFENFKIQKKKKSRKKILFSHVCVELRKYARSLFFIIVVIPTSKASFAISFSRSLVFFLFCFFVGNIYINFIVVHRAVFFMKAKGGK